MEDHNKTKLITGDYVKVKNFTGLQCTFFVGKVISSGISLDTVNVEYQNYFYSFSSAFLEKMTDGEATLYILESEC